MIEFTQGQVDAALLRIDDLFAAAARDRLTAPATRPSPAAAPRTVGRICASLRQAISSLVALASIG